MIEHEVMVNGRRALSVAYLSLDLQPMDKMTAEMAKVVFADGEITYAIFEPIKPADKNDIKELAQAVKDLAQRPVIVPPAQVVMPAAPPPIPPAPRPESYDIEPKPGGGFKITPKRPK